MTTGRSKLFVPAILSIIPATLVAAPALQAPNVTVGSNLQTTAIIKLTEPAPDGGLNITLSSRDTGKVRLSTDGATAGSESIALKVRAGFMESPEFWIQGLAAAGEAIYTAEALGCGKAEGKVALTPSGIAIVGPSRAQSFQTTRRALSSRIALYPARLDPALKVAEQQPLAGGISLDLKVSTSNPAIGHIAPATVKLAGGSTGATIDFKPASPGSTTISVTQPQGYTQPAELASVTVVVNAPRIAITSEVMVGENLQIAGLVALGEAAPEGGLKVKLASDDPSKLLLAASPTDAGSESITIEIPQGQVNSRFFIQALGRSGSVTYTATAPGFVSRMGKVLLAPSAVVLATRPVGSGAETEQFRKDAADASRGFVCLLSKKTDVELGLWTAQLDPVTLRWSEITVQPLRAGLKVKVEFANSNPAVGKILSPVTITGGSEQTIARFTPVSPGSTELSLVTPAGFTPAGNSTSTTAVVRE